MVISAECALCTSPCFYCFQIHQGETTAGTLLFAGTLGNISSDSLLCSFIISFLIKVSMSCLNSLITNRCTLALWWSTAFFKNDYCGHHVSLLCNKCKPYNTCCLNFSYMINSGIFLLQLPCITRRPLDLLFLIYFVFATGVAFLRGFVSGSCPRNCWISEINIGFA